MSKTIEEIKNYFNERPELKEKIDKAIGGIFYNISETDNARYGNMFYKWTNRRVKIR